MEQGTPSAINRKFSTKCQAGGMVCTKILRAFAGRYPFDGEVLEREALPTLQVCGLFTSVLGCGVIAGLVQVDVGDLAGSFGAAGVLWIAGLMAQCIRLRLAGEALKSLAFFALLCLVAPLASAVLARISGPLSDAILVRADRLLFFNFNWVETVKIITAHPTLMRILNDAYYSLNWQPVFLIVFFCLSGNPRASWSMMQVFSVAMAMCIAIFPFVPAVGGYVHFGIPADAVPSVRIPVAWDSSVLLYGLKNGTITLLGSEALAGIVTMPSFHVAAAIVLGWSAWSSRWLRWPFGVLNFAMIISSVPVGGHYVVDTVAGAACALISIRFVTGPIGASRKSAAIKSKPAACINEATGAAI